MRGFLPDQTRISQVHLRTASLRDALEFYSGVLGLTASQESDSQAILSARPKEPGLVVLSEDCKASPRQGPSIGLYHFALRYGTRNDLAYAYRRIVRAGYPVAGASDHGVSEAIYLSDPDGNGVELGVEFLQTVPGMLVIVMTGTILPSEEEALCEEHNFPVLRKPFLASDVMNQIRSRLLPVSGVVRA